MTKKAEAQRNYGMRGYRPATARSATSSKPEAKAKAKAEPKKAKKAKKG